MVCGLCLALARFSSAADFISIPLDCKGLQASEAGQQRIQVSDFRVFPTAPTRRKLVREIHGIAGVHFLQIPGERGNPSKASDAERFVPCSASNSSIHGDRYSAPGVWHPSSIA